MPQKSAERIKVFAVCSILQALLQIAKSQENVNLLEKGVGKKHSRSKNLEAGIILHCPRRTGRWGETGKGQEARTGDPKSSPGSATDWLGDWLVAPLSQLPPPAWVKGKG